MKPFRSSGLALVAALCAIFAVGQPAAAQTPGRNITIVVPFTPGGNTNDILARLFAEEFKQRLGGQTVIVENKPGASGNIGAQVVATAAPDGHTLLESGSPLIQNVGLFKNLPYDPIKSFAPIIRLAEVSIALVVNPSVPVKTTQEFVDYLKARPGQLNYSSPGHGTPHHLTMELFKQATGTNLMHIPARGSAPAVQDLVGGQVSAMFLPMSVAMPLVQGGQIRMLAVASAKRQKIAPDVPTLTEQGIKGMEVPLWYGLWAPAGTPPEIVARYNKMANEGLRTPEMLDKFEKQSIEPVGGTAEEFRAFIADDLVKWTKILKDAGIVAE
jgi:tripartite-type tricarboxylate transporter receptor subunit TctC